MSFLIKIERCQDGETSESSIELIEGESISIGRGAGAQLRLHSEAIAPLHALIEIRDGGAIIQDLGSPVGTIVNGVKIQSATLQAGDQVQVGPHTLKVFRQESSWGVLLNADELSISNDDQRAIVDQLNSLDLHRQLPSLFSLSLVMIFAAVALFLFIPLLGGDKGSWNSGQLTSAHSFIADDCQKCHSVPFAAVQDRDCVQCHEVAEHSKNLKEIAHHFPIAAKRCAECHMEHNGKEGVHLRDNRQCVSCHGSLATLKKDSFLKDVTSFAQHPEFRLTKKIDESVSERIEIGNSEIKDSSKLYLNHAVHLEENIRGPNGRTTLTCADCHQFDVDKQRLLRVRYEKDCRSCHTLEFDPKLPEREVPHGNEAEIREFLFAEYSQYYLQLAEQQKPEEPKRIKPGAKAAAIEYNRATLALITQAAKEAEKELYTKTGCQLCHQIKQIESGHQVEKVASVSSWLPFAKFNHRPHLQMKCDDCHNGVRKSESTEDILLPKIAQCRECHADTAEHAKVPSDCVVCHQYH